MAEKNAISHVYKLRWEKINEAYTEIESHLLGAEILWGKEVNKQIMPLRKKVTELNIGLQQHLTPEIRTKDAMELFNLVYNQSSEDKEDKFSEEVSNIVNYITGYIALKIK